MDIISLVVGFVVGTATGAVGSYLADKFTDARRKKQLINEEKSQWEQIERRFPTVISEMRADFSTPDGKSVRAFFVKESNTIMGFISEP